MAFFKKHNPEKSVLAVVIESGSVHLGLALVATNKPPVVVWEAIEHFPYQKKVSPETMETNVFDAVTRGCQGLIKDGLAHVVSRSLKKGHIDELHILYASPWHVSQAKVLTVRHDKPFAVTEELVRDVVHKETEALLKEQAGQSGFSSDMSIIEERITDIALNGYSVHDPYGKRTENLTLIVFVSAVAKVFREKIEETIARSVHTEHIQHHSFSVAFFATIRDVFAAGKDFLMVYAGEELTDVTYARGETLRDTASFPMGRAGLIRTIADELKCLPEEAVSLLSLKHLASLKTTQREDARQAVEKACAVWAGYVRETLGGFLPQGGLPRAVFLVCQPEADVFKAALERGDWFGKSTGSAFDVMTMSGKAFGPFLKAAGGIKQISSHAGVGILYAQKTMPAK